MRKISARYVGSFLLGRPPTDPRVLEEICQILNIPNRVPNIDIAEMEDVEGAENPVCRITFSSGERCLFSPFAEYLLSCGDHTHGFPLWGEVDESGAFSEDRNRRVFLFGPVYTPRPQDT